jgi:hypothetical protein
VKPKRQLVRTGNYASSPVARQLRDGQVRNIVRRLRMLCPWIEASDIHLTRRFCELELLSSRAYQALRNGELLNDKGESRRLLSDYRQLVMAQTAVARELGLSPAARMAIKANSTSAALDLVGEFAKDASAARLAEK